MQQKSKNIYYNPIVAKKVNRRNLPHWKQTEKLYFVTFRTADSIPQDKMELFRRKRQQWQQQHSEPYSEKDKVEYRILFSEKANTWLNNCYGECLLADLECANIVRKAIEYFNGERYFLDHWVIMPNHIHVLLIVRQRYDLSKIFHSWKSFTSNKINRIYSRTGSFWQAETFDHIVRNSRQLEKYREYIKMNIDKAGVCWSQKSILLCNLESKALRQDA